MERDDALYYRGKDSVRKESVKVTRQAQCTIVSKKALNSSFYFTSTKTIHIYKRQNACNTYSVAQVSVTKIVRINKILKCIPLHR